MHRFIHLVSYIFLLAGIVFSHEATAQSKELEEMWQRQVRTEPHDMKRIEYLHVDQETIDRLFDKLPSFGMHHDNYIITGISTNKKIDKYTADAKFQMSISQRLFKSVLPFHTFLLMTYTQKSFWEIYQNSAPFADNNYNPGFLLVKPIVHNNGLWGLMYLGFEHESNGQDSIRSRNWNYFLFSGTHFFNIYFSGQVKCWAGWLGGANKDLYKYRGYGLFALNYRSLEDNFRISLVVNPRSGFKSFNTQLELNFKMGHKANQYFFVQWYNGYGESLLEYNKYCSMVRVGICLTPPLRNLY
ncbi:MAG: phospholipase A [Dysgonamonadaceae bacterium]|nr:phospholipase A [Dysgonamonadaceae bacterium]